MSELLASLRLKGISGGGNGAVITVTYGAEFYNQTFVATNNVDTVSVVATSLGTVDIDVPSEGSWVISCTIGADTYTSDPVSVDLSYDATITAIPNGKTVLPTDDIETWLECAGITDKAYTTLAEVLADTDTYTTLLGDSNACDYMARSTTWASTIVADADAMRLLGMYDYACDALLSDSTWASAICNSTYFESVLNVKVPTMTSNTAPSGEASASSSGSSYAPYKAFDGNQGTKWLASSNGDGWLQYEFASAIRLARVELFIAKSVTNTSEYLESITGANDGAETTIFDTQTLINSSSQNVTTILPITHSGSYKKIKLNLSIPNTVQAYADEVQFYGRKPVQTDIIVSAPSDTIYYMDNGSPVTLCTTDTDGIGSVDWSDLPTGDITLYSSVAKNPTDLTADYGKSIRVSKYKTQAYLMPDTGVLYWWGYESADLEDCNTANGWSRSSYTMYTPTRNANSLTCSSVINYGVSMIANKNTVDIGTKVNSVWKGTHAYNSTYGYIVEYPTKTMTTATYYYTLESTSVLHTTYTMVTNAYPTVGVNAQAGGAGNYRECELYAVWLE